jgi:hypothetical protein
MGMSSDKFNITFFDVNETINTVKTAHEELAKEAAAITGAVVVTPAKPKSNNPLDGMDL